METNQILTGSLIFMTLFSAISIIVALTFIKFYEEMRVVSESKDSLLSKQAAEIKELKELIQKHSDLRVAAINSANKNAKQNSYLKKKISNLSTDLSFNNIVGYKFKPGQEVFVVYESEIKKGIIDYIGIEVFDADYEVYYIIKGLTALLYEDEVFSTKEMAAIRLSELNNQ